MDRLFDRRTKRFNERPKRRERERNEEIGGVCCCHWRRNVEENIKFSPVIALHLGSSLVRSRHVCKCIGGFYSDPKPSASTTWKFNKGRKFFVDSFSSFSQTMSANDNNDNEYYDDDDDEGDDGETTKVVESKTTTTVNRRILDAAPTTKTDEQEELNNAVSSSKPTTTTKTASNTGGGPSRSEKRQHSKSSSNRKQTSSNQTAAAAAAASASTDETTNAADGCLDLDVKKTKKVSLADQSATSAWLKVVFFSTNHSQASDLA